MKICGRCGDETETKNLFCPSCGAAYSTDDLRKVRLMGLVGVANSTSPKIEQFLATGDPEVL